MGNTLDAYRAAIGSFLCRIKDKKIKYSEYLENCEISVLIFLWLKNLQTFEYPSQRSLTAIDVGFTITYAISNVLTIILLLCGDVHRNPGPTNNANSKSLTICHANIRSLKTNDNMNHVRADLAGNFDVIVLTETWLKSTDSSDDFCLADYQHPIRQDRTFEPLGYGGIIAWVSDNVNFKRRMDLENRNLEMMWLEINTCSGKLFLCALYRTNSNADPSFWNDLQDNLDNVKALYNCKVMLIGDLNADFNTRNGQTLQRFASANDLTIHVNTPTRVTENSATVLDQILSNFPHSVNDVATKPAVGSSDHYAITATCSFRVHSKSSYTRTMWAYSDEAFEQYRQTLAAHEWNCLNVENANEACEQFSAELISIAKSTIPNKEAIIRTHDKPWFNNYLRRLRRKRNRLFEKLKQENNDINRHIYKEFQRSYRLEIKRIKKEYEETKYSSLASNAERNSKKWWSIIKSLHNKDNAHNSIPPLETDDKIITTNAEKAEMFNKHFLSASTLNDANCLIPNNPPINESILDEIMVTIEDVKDQLKTLDTSKAFGPDNISPKFLKEGASILAPILQSLFNKCLQQSVFPDIWKRANVIPIHKKDSKDNVSNYRPISLLSCTGKLFERIIFKYVYNYFHANFILSQLQSGFLPGRSTITQLLEMYDEFCKAVDSKKETRAVFLDISKAFDRVWHRGLLYKIQNCGIGGSLLEWFRDYLQNRKQRVVINGATSSWGTIPSGVPQGSVLGPLLFLVYINDLIPVIKHCNVRLFADDTCLFANVDRDREHTMRLINQDLVNVSRWADQWLVSFSPSKTKSIVFSNKQDAILNPRVKYKDVEIDEVPSHSYLGLLFTRSLRWGEHIDAIAVKARRRLTLMLPLKYKLDRKTLLTMFQSFVKPVMEYGIAIWGGSYDCDISKLEKINSDGMRLITGAPANSNIRKLYEETGISSIRQISNSVTLKLFYKIVNNLTPNYLRNLLPVYNPRDTGYNLRNTDEFGRPKTRLDIRQRSFIPRAIRLWNRLPADCREAPTLLSFARKLKQDGTTSNPLYNYGDRLPAAHHARLRMGCSALNYDLCYNLHVKDQPGCRCGAPLETSYHYLMECPLYKDAREALQISIERLAGFNINIVLRGSDSLNNIENKCIFDAVHKYINDTKRFY